MTKFGALISLAYPEAFVKATNGKYNRILESAGIVNAGLVKAGHAAACIVDHDGTIHYSDFGRYITPQTSGRARTIHTDPEVVIPIKAEFSNIGIIKNLNEIAGFLLDNPQLTHGHGDLYMGVFYNVDHRKAINYAWQTSLKGSMSYGPFVINGSNCARYVWSLLWTSGGLGLRTQLISRMLPSPMPLDLIMCAEVYNRYQYKQRELLPFSKRRWPIWKKLFERPGSEHLLSIDRSQLFESSGTWLEGIGDGAWFELEMSTPDGTLISRRTDRGEKVFSHWFTALPQIDDVGQLKFVFDCNAQFCTVQLNSDVVRLEKLSHDHQLRLNQMHNVSSFHSRHTLQRNVQKPW